MGGAHPVRPPPPPRTKISFISWGFSENITKILGTRPPPPQGLAPPPRRSSGSAAVDGKIQTGFLRSAKIGIDTAGRIQIISCFWVPRAQNNLNLKRFIGEENFFGQNQNLDFGCTYVAQTGKMIKDMNDSHVAIVFTPDRFCFSDFNCSESDE